MLRDYDGYRQQIREIYKQVGPVLEKGVRLSPYDLGIQWEFSPIEDNVWGNIRYLGIPLYPEFPVGPYFIDFADPKKKIGIEVDSIKWHKDKSKDMVKDKYLRSCGWNIYRIPSHMTYKTREDFIDEDGNVNLEDYVFESSEGFLWDIYKNEDKFIYFTRLRLV